jgi:heat shock 70kDa protein 1/2/6/8
MPRGVPQIDVTFDIDASGILNVSAVEKSTGKEKKITIKNDKGRMSAEDIERLVQEAERFNTEDLHHREKVDAMARLENYLYQMGKVFADERLKGKISAADKTAATTALGEVSSWLGENRAAEKEEFLHKLEYMEAIIIPIVKRFSEHAPAVATDAAAASAPPEAEKTASDNVQPPSDGQA